MKPLFATSTGGLVLGLAAGILGYVATTGRVEVVSCARSHRLFAAVVDCHNLRGVAEGQPMCIFPLFDDRKEVVGVMQVVGKDREECFNDGEVRVIEGLSR